MNIIKTYASGVGTVDDCLLLSQDWLWYHCWFDDGLLVDAWSGYCSQAQDWYWNCWFWQVTWPDYHGYAILAGTVTHVLLVEDCVCVTTWVNAAYASSIYLQQTTISQPNTFTAGTNMIKSYDDLRWIEPEVQVLQFQDQTLKFGRLDPSITKKPNYFKEDA